MATTLRLPGLPLVTSTAGPAPVCGFFEAISRESRRPATAFPHARQIFPLPGFRTRTAGRRLANALLQGGLRGFLFGLQAWAQTPVRVLVTPGRVGIEVERRVGLREADALEGLLARLTALVLRAEQEVAVGAMRRSFHPEAARCPVCGVPTGRARVLCGSCQAPHHSDCWAWLGGCGIFGCAGARARPGVKTATETQRGSGRKQSE